jgi:hypothetical protein
VPDIADPASLNGFGPSPVFWTDAPTVTLSVAASQANDLRFFAGWRDGRVYSMTAVQGAAGTNQLTISTAYLQLSGPPTRQDADGKDRLSLTFRVVRFSLGDANPPYTITYKYDAAA